MGEGYLFIGCILLWFLVVFLAVKEYRERLKPTTTLELRRNSSGEEKRTHPRHKTSLRIKYKTLDDKGIREGMSWLKDISRGGMRLFLDKQIEKGTFLTLEIDLPFERDPVFAQSSVVWKEGDEAGLIFDEIREGDLDRILEYIDRRAQLNSLIMEK